LSLISGGSRFHASGADMAKQRHPKSVAVETTTTSPRVDDRSPLLALTDDTGWQKSAIVVQDHVKPCRLANKACTVSVVELAASEVDHAAHD